MGVSQTIPGEKILRALRLPSLTNRSTTSVHAAQGCAKDGLLTPSVREKLTVDSGKTNGHCSQEEQWPFVSRLAPRAGLEPATSRLQDPQSFDWAWTISSPACRIYRGGCRALMRRYRIGSSASSLCTFLHTPSFDGPFCRLRSGFPFRTRGDGFPEFTRCFNHSFPWRLQL